MENTQLGDQQLMEQAWWTWDSVARSLAQTAAAPGRECLQQGGDSAENSDTEKQWHQRQI